MLLSSRMVSSRRRRRELASQFDPATAIYWASEWRTATGLTSAAFLDSANPFGPWDGEQGGNGGSPSASEIMPNDGSLIGYGNFFRVRNAGINSRQVRKDQMYPESTTHFGRAYVRANRTTGNHRHWVSMGGLSGNPIQVGLGLPSSAGSQSGGSFFNITGAYNEAGTLLVSPYSRWTMGGVDNPTAFDPLVQNEWLLVEWQVLFRSATTYSLRAKASPVDSFGKKIVVDKWTTANFKNADWNVGNTADLDTWPSANAAHGLGGTGGTPANARRYLLGNEGPSGGVTDGGYFDIASFAISTEGWIGDQGNLYS